MLRVMLCKVAITLRVMQRRREHDIYPFPAVRAMSRGFAIPRLRSESEGYNVAITLRVMQPERPEG